MARKKFTYKEHKERMLGIIERPKQTPQVDRRGILSKLIETARAKRGRV